MLSHLQQQLACLQVLNAAYLTLFIIPYTEASKNVWYPVRSEKYFHWCMKTNVLENEHKLSPVICEIDGRWKYSMHITGVGVVH